MLHGPLIWLKRAIYVKSFWYSVRISCTCRWIYTVHDYDQLKMKQHPLQEQHFSKGLVSQCCASGSSAETVMTVSPGVSSSHLTIMESSGVSVVSEQMLTVTAVRRRDEWLSGYGSSRFQYKSSLMELERADRRSRHIPGHHAHLTAVQNCST